MKNLILSMLSAAVLAVGAVAHAAPVKWEAQWIWQEGDGPANSWVAFRKDVRIDEVPEKVVAHVSADSKYWMWINGELAVFEGSVARGPSPAKPWKRQKEMWTLPPETKPSNTWYEEVDITRHLKKGDNTIAVLVWYWGRETHKGTHIDSGKGGFIFQADLNGKQLVSDRSWKVKADPAYGPERADVDKMVLQYNVNYDARKEMGGWTAAGFPDADWKPASEKGLPPSAPWYELERNYVPALVNHGLKFYESHPESRFPFASTGETIVCKLPFNKQITPYLEVECDGGQEIKVTTDNPLNRISASYITKPGRQAFEAYSWMNGHDVRYDIPKGVKVHGLKYRWMSVGEIAGSFECSDPFYKRLWDMGVNTLFVCARDNFMDCPDRERACWIGDVADQAGYLFYCMDESGRQLLKKAIRITMAYSHRDIFGALGPLRIRELPAQSLQFIEQGIWQHYLNTGDEDTLRFAYPYVRDYLALWEMREDGLPAKRKPSMDYWNWLDWGREGTIDQPVILDALYYMALTGASKMARTLGEAKDIAGYEKSIADLRKGFRTAYWKDGFYSSNPKKFQDDRANALAILTGLASEDQHDSIVKRVLIPNQFCSPHFEWMVEEAMCVAGRHDAALARMKERYQSQVDRKGMTTLYEKFPKGGSYNHAWNAPNTVLSKHIAGIAPEKVGWKGYHVLPNLAHLTAVKQVVPSVMGEIVVDIRREKNSFHLELASPEGTMARVGIPKSFGQIVDVKANGMPVWNRGRFTAGDHGIVEAGEDDHFLKFRVPPGSWKIVATTR